MFEELRVCFTSPKVKVADFEIAPNYILPGKKKLAYRPIQNGRTMAPIVSLSSVIGKESHCIVWRY